MNAIASTLSILAEQVKNANKIPADDFDKFDSKNSQTSKSENEKVPSKNTNLLINTQQQKKKIDLLDQGKVLADSFDNDSSSKSSKK